MSRVPQSLVCGLHDSISGRGALAWAAHVLTNGPAPFTLVHAGSADATDMVGEAEEYLVTAGAATTVERFDAPDDPVSALRQASEGARMVVVGRREADGVVDRLIGSHAYRLAEQAHCPVVVVPAGWSVSAASGRPVVLALDDGYDAAAIDFALAMAHDTGHDLRAVHGSHLPAIYDGGDFDPDALDDWLARRRSRMQEHLIAHRDEIGSRVKVQADVVVGSPVDVLLEQATDASLLVIAGHSAERLIASPMGPVAHALLRRCPCPVAFAHPGAVRRGADPAPEMPSRA